MGFRIERSIPITAMTFEDVVRHAGFVPDYLSTDVEGYDLRILQSIDLKKYPVKVIVAEWDDSNERVGDTMAKYLEKQGYSPHKKFINNALFIRNQ